jgi:hypothetical protein
MISPDLSRKRKLSSPHRACFAFTEIRFGFDDP